MTWCWWCCHAHESPSLSMPYKYDDRRNKFHTAGNFCSWSCMKSYAIDKYGVSRGGIICGNIVMMRRKMFNQLTHVQPAPNRFKLGVFGGDMTIESFRENATRDDTPPNVIQTVPMVENLIPPVVNTKRMDDINNSTTDGGANALKLKRTKPLKRSHTNLESVLGLIITPQLPQTGPS